MCGPLAAAQASPSDFYVSSTGNDGSPGTSPTQAWRTITRVNQQVLRPGDSVLFEGGSVFGGTISLTGTESGTTQDPIVFDSFGTGQAVIWANTGSGLDFYNVSGIRISNLLVAGSGIDTNNGIGISFYTDLPGDVKLPWIRVDHCRVTGFRRGGISVGGYNGSTGFENVRVTFNRLDHNGNNGLATWGFFDPTWGQTLADYPHNSIYIGHNLFESNWGDPQRTTKHTGSGCEIAQAALVLRVAAVLQAIAPIFSTIAYVFPAIEAILAPIANVLEPITDLSSLAVGSSRCHRHQQRNGQYDADRVHQMRHCRYPPQALDT